MSVSGYLSISDVSNLLGLRVEQVVELARGGGLPAVRDGEAWYIPRSGIQTWIADCGKRTRSVRKAPGSRAAPVFNIVECADMDHYTEKPGGWDVQISKLSKGDFHTRARSIAFTDFVVYNTRWNTTSLIRGQTPEGFLMLGSFADSESSAHWCGKQLGSRRFACAGEGREAEWSIHSQARNRTVLIKPELIQKIAGGEAVELVRRSEHLEFDWECGGQLLDVIDEILDRFESQPHLLEQPAIAAHVRSVLLRALENCFSNASSRESESASLRELAVHGAIEHASKALEYTGACDMAQAVGVSQKTLEKAFKQVLGMTPARYLMLSRLNAAHRQLVDGQADELTVLQVALQWGFSHSGRFSTAYRQLFGELPSRTLRHSSHHA